jgi:VanZ family protein
MATARRAIPLSPPALRAWALVLAWLIAILVFSSDPFSASTTGSLLGPFLRWLFPDWSPGEIWRLHYTIRKVAHLTVYGVLALLAYRAFALSLPAGRLAIGALSLLLVLAAAASDEYHQSFSRLRTGSLFDVGYDLAGAAAALGLAAMLAGVRDLVRGRRGGF